MMRAFCVRLRMFNARLSSPSYRYRQSAQRRYGPSPPDSINVASPQREAPPGRNAKWRGPSHASEHRPRDRSPTTILCGSTGNGRKVMEWFGRKTSIAGIQIPDWMVVLGAVIVILLAYSFMH
jgi:hypothetical protein